MDDPDFRDTKPPVAPMYTLSMARLGRIGPLSGPIALQLRGVVQQLNLGSIDLDISTGREFQMYLVASGVVSFTRGTAAWKTEPGEITFLFPGDSLKLRIWGKTSLFHAHFNLSAHDADFQLIEIPASPLAVESETQEGQYLYLAEQFQVRNLEALTESLASVLRAQAAVDCHRHLAALGHFLIALDTLSAEIEHASIPEMAPALPLTRISQVHVARAIQTIESRRHQQQFTLQSLAAELELNPDYLNRIFKSIVGESVGQHIIRRKVAFAKSLLLSTTLTVKEVATAAGFRDQLYFSRAFRKRTGHSPSAYLKHHSGRGPASNIAFEPT